ncbi:Riboflavin kinase [Bienertia sinuspersici]
MKLIKQFGKSTRHLVNECGRIVRTRAPLNVKNWQEAFSVAGDSMWKEIRSRLWKCRLHYYYKSPKCGKTDQERENNPPPDLPIRNGNIVYNILSERNSENRLSDKRVIHTTGNLAFAEVEDILTKENDNVKPSADVVWLIEHTLLEPRYGYILSKGTALCGYVRGKQQLERRKLVEEQQGKIQEQEKRIKELQESQERQQREFEEHKAKQAADMEAFKQDLLLQLANRGV